MMKSWVRRIPVWLAYSGRARRSRAHATAARRGPHSSETTRIFRPSGAVKALAEFSSVCFPAALGAVSSRMLPLRGRFQSFGKNSGNRLSRFSALRMP